MPTIMCQCGNCQKSFETLVSYQNEKYECPLCGSSGVEEIKKRKRKDKGNVIELFDNKEIA